MATIKKGSTFEATLLFTENEWVGIYPWDEIIAFVGQESKRVELDTEVDADTMSVNIVGDTSSWNIGPAKFDIWVMKNEKTIPIPNGYSIDLMIIQGGLT